MTGVRGLCTLRIARPRRAASLLLAAVVACLGHGPSHADAEEKRLGAAGLGVLASTVEGGVRGEGWAWGGRVVFGYGLSNPLELRLTSAVAFGPALEFSGATVGNLKGDLFGDLLTIEGTAGLRVNAGPWLSPVFSRTRPFVELRGGLLVRRLSGQILLGPGNMLITSPDDTTSVLPLLAGGVGLEHRFGRSFLAALSFDGVFATDGTRHLGASLEGTFTWY
jgi:hypothetical protein